MKIPIDREKKVLLLKWLKRGFIDTNDIPELNDVRDNWFEQLMKGASVREDTDE